MVVLMMTSFPAVFSGMYTGCIRDVHRNPPSPIYLVFSLRASCPAANSQCVKEIHNKTFNSLAAILNCKVGELSEKEVLARIHLHTGPGLGFVDLRKVAGPAYCAAWLQAVHRLSQFKDGLLHLLIHPEPHGTYQELATKALANKDLIESDPFIHL